MNTLRASYTHTLPTRYRKKSCRVSFVVVFNFQKDTEDDVYISKNENIHNMSKFS